MLNETKCIHCGKMTPVRDKLAEDYKFGQIFSMPSSEEDKQAGIDVWLSSEGTAIPLSWRKRRISIGKYKQVSIRYSRGSGNKTEFQKLLDGEIKSWFYFFEFRDAIVICSTEDVKRLMQRGDYQVQDNYDAGDTVGAYIDLDNIEHLLVKKKDFK